MGALRHNGFKDAHKVIKINGEGVAQGVMGGRQRSQKLASGGDTYLALESRPCFMYQSGLGVQY